MPGNRLASTLVYEQWSLLLRKSLEGWSSLPFWPHQITMSFINSNWQCCLPVVYGKPHWADSGSVDSFAMPSAAAVWLRQDLVLHEALPFVYHITNVEISVCYFQFSLIILSFIYNSTITHRHLIGSKVIIFLFSNVKNCSKNVLLHQLLPIFEIYHYLKEVFVWFNSRIMSTSNKFLFNAWSFF